MKYCIRIMIGVLFVALLGGIIIGDIPSLETVAYATEIEADADVVDPDWVGDVEEESRFEYEEYEEDEDEDDEEEFVFQSGEPNNKGYVESEEEERIYSYVQCPRDHYSDKRWVGDWPEIEAGGQTFWGFGCGICCLSNMVNTLTEYVNTPDQMYVSAKECTDYYPESGVGALTWEQLSAVAEYYELGTAVCEKPEYDLFQEDMSVSDTAVVLVCSANDDTLWSTRGHYVNIWAYDSETDTVFVTDSSGRHNRERVALRDVYNALKTSSPAQYMCVWQK